MKEIINKVLQWTIRCEACSGTGKWPTQKNPEGRHFKCNGTGHLMVKAMSDKQLNFIRNLFKELVEMEVIIKGDGLWNDIVNTMQNHKQAAAIENVDGMLSTHDASDIIEMLKDRKSRHIEKLQLRKLDAQEALNFQEPSYNEYEDCY